MLSYIFTTCCCPTAEFPKQPSVAATLEAPQVCFCLVGCKTIAQHLRTEAASQQDLLVRGGGHRVGRRVAVVEFSEQVSNKMMQQIIKYRLTDKYEALML